MHFINKTYKILKQKTTYISPYILNSWSNIASTAIHFTGNLLFVLLM